VNRLGRVYLVGAGPGDPDLITVRGRALLQSADVVLYDRLAPVDLLACARADAALIDVGKSSGDGGIGQRGICRQLVTHSRKGKCVVRLKGGDPFVFGRGFEELLACRRAGIVCEVIPGVSSALAAPASAAVPVTFRNEARSMAVVTGRTANGSITDAIDFDALAAMDSIVLMMGREALESFCHALIHAGRNRATPAVCIEQATTPKQRVTRGTLQTIAIRARAAGVSAPVVTLIGPTARYAQSVAASLPAVKADHTPLLGRRVVITRPPGDASWHLQTLLRRAGADVIDLPMFSVHYPERNPRLDRAISRIEVYDWLVFTSAHAVQAFWLQLAAMGGDSRWLADVRVPAVGTATADQLLKAGIQADLIPPHATAVDLADAIRDAADDESMHVLYPRSALASATLKDRLRNGRGQVDDPVAYRLRALRPLAAQKKSLNRGADAVLFFSPSAVRRYAMLNLPVGLAVVGCVGDVTARAASDAGLRVGVVATESSNEGMVAALSAHFEKDKRRR